MKETIVDLIKKNRNRTNYVFANINLLGKCNADCYFCLGKDIDNLLSKHNQLKIHFSKWLNFEAFLNRCNQLGIKKLYLTGQNTDPLLYRYLGKLIDYLQSRGFSVGIRTNGYLAKQKIDLINKCYDEIGYSIHSLDPETNYKIMKRKNIPDWNFIIPNTKNVRIAIVLNRYNVNEFWNLLRYISKFDNVKYVQVRQISSDTRIKNFIDDIKIYEEVFNYVDKNYKRIEDFYLAQRYIIFGKEVNFWRTVETSINSINYFADGTLSNEYFIVEGYLKNYRRINNEI